MSLTLASTSDLTTSIAALATPTSTTTKFTNSTVSAQTFTTKTSTTTLSVPLQTNALKPNFTGGPKLGVLEILIPISVAAWIMMGVACVLCINGKQGRAGRWIPEWYLDSSSASCNKGLVVLWWVAVMLLWPALLPVQIVKEMRSQRRPQSPKKQEQNVVSQVEA